MKLFAGVALALGLAEAMHMNPISLRKRELRRQQQAIPEGMPKYKAHFFDVPIDHFPNNPMYAPHVTGKFGLRYWFDATYYQSGGPVILFESGEASASDRLPILYSGIVNKLSKATRGVGVIIEHRYYGRSQPMPNLDTENLRFLTTDQAMADNDYFARHITFPGMEDYNLTAPGTPWIQYGGSYSGAFAAISRTIYPETYWGAISSSGVVEAIYNYWRYFEGIRLHAPKTCVENTQYLTNLLDNIFITNKAWGPLVKEAFNMSTISHDTDFVYTLEEYSIGDWQATNWDPAVNYIGFEKYCEAVTTNKLLYPKVARNETQARKIITEGGYSNMTNELLYPLLNWIGFAQEYVIPNCASSNLDDCFNTYVSYPDRHLDQNGLLCWPYQYCNQWGFYQTGSGVPKSQYPLISRLVDLEYSTNICRYAFNITKERPDTEATNKYGGFNIEYERLAIIDGIADPWRYATPHSPTQKPWDRKDTLNKPFYLIGNGSVHHWDENGIRPSKYTHDFPPTFIRHIQDFEQEFVLKWMDQWYVQHPNVQRPSKWQGVD